LKITIIKSINQKNYNGFQKILSTTMSTTSKSTTTTTTTTTMNFDFKINNNTFNNIKSKIRKKIIQKMLKIIKIIKIKEDNKLKIQFLVENYAEELFLI